MSLPTVIRSGKLLITPSLELTVHVLDNGQRVIDKSDMTRFFRWLRTNPDDVALNAGTVERLEERIREI